MSVDQCPALIGPVGDAARAVGPARIHLRGPASGGALRFADNTWLRVERRVESGVPIPTLDAVTVRRVDAPANPNV